MNIEQTASLSRLLSGHRRRMERAWSAETVHPAWTYVPGQPSGQCGPTTVWLCEALNRQGMALLVYAGYVWTRGNTQAAIDVHVWGQVGDMIIDVTADQADEIPYSVIVSSHRHLLERGIRYQTTGITSHKSLRGTALWRRYEKLEAALASEGGQDDVHIRPGRALPGDGDPWRRGLQPPGTHGTRFPGRHGAHM